MTAPYFRWGHKELRKSQESRNADDGQLSESERNLGTNNNRLWKTKRERNEIFQIISQLEKNLEDDETPKDLDFTPTSSKDGIEEKWKHKKGEREEEEK